MKGMSAEKDWDFLKGSGTWDSRTVRMLLESAASRLTGEAGHRRISPTRRSEGSICENSLSLIFPCFRDRLLQALRLQGLRQGRSSRSRDEWAKFAGRPDFWPLWGTECPMKLFPERGMRRAFSLIGPWRKSSR
jgi:hypothetical protein